MSRWSKAIFIILLMGFFTIPANTLAMTGVVQSQEAPAAHGILVKFKTNVSRNSRLNTLSTAGSQEMARFRIVPGLSHARVLSGQTMEETLQTLRSNPNVAYAEPNYMVTVQQTIPDDPKFSSLYGLHNSGQSGGSDDADIDAPEAWDIETGSRDIVIAIIDTGVDYTHEDLKDNMWVNVNEIPDNGIDDDGNGYIDDYRGWDFANNDNDPMDDHFHGTHVAGTIAAQANNGVGVAGINWQARIMPLKFLTKDGNGSIESAIAAIEYAASMGAQISNNSWGGAGGSQALHEAIVNAEKMGHLFVAAAANDGQSNEVSPKYPASYDLPNIIAVAATDNKDNLASFSNYGVTTVDLGAPGVDILSSSPGNGYRLLSGTSMATPHVTGVAGLVWAHNPGISYAEVKTAILDNVDPVPSLNGRTVTGGRLNAFKALQSLQGLLTVTPARATVAAGATLAFTVDGGNAPYTWSVSNPGVANIDTTSGVLLALAAGTTKVQVTDANGDTGSTADIIITQTTVAPQTGLVAVGQTTTFAASGGTAPYIWSSSDAGIAVIDSGSGILTAIAPGTVRITATDSNGIAGGSGDIIVVDSNLSVTPQTAVLGVGEKVQFSVSGGTPPYSWETTHGAVASIDNNGILTGIGAGTSKVSVTDGLGLSGLSQTIEVRNIVIKPNTGAIPTADTLQLSVSGGVAPYHWQVSNPNVASIDASGLLTGLSGGTVYVKTTDADGAAGTSGAFTVEGSGPPQIAPRIVYLNKGYQLQLKATGGTPPYTWTTGNPYIVGVDNTGTLSANGIGSTFIGLHDSQLRSDSIFVTVRDMRILPATATLSIGQSLQFAVSGGVGPYRWSVSSTTVATISSQGVLTAHNPGRVVVTALDQYGLEARTGEIIVSDGGTLPPPPPPPPPGLVITPDTASLSPGDTLQFTASGGSAPYTWSSSNPSVATVSSSGLLTARAAGSVILSVTDAGGVTARTSSISIVAADLSLTPVTGSLVVGTTLQFTASGGTAPYTWSVSNVYVASINSYGLLSGRAAGDVVVKVTDARGQSVSSGTISVTNPTTPGLKIEPDTAQLNVGDSLQFTLTGGKAPIFWSTTNAAVSRIISNTGLLTAVAPGTTQVRAWDSSGASVLSGTITINGTLPQPLGLTPTTATLAVGDTLQFEVAGGTAPYFWSSLNSFVASVDANGLLSAKAAGFTAISVRDSRGQTASTGLISVAAASAPPGGGTPSPISLTPETAVVPRGGLMQFFASGGRQPYSWSVSDSLIGTVGPTGIFQANFIRTGTTTITVTDANGDAVTSGTIEVR